MGYPLRDLTLGQTHYIYSRCIDNQLLLKNKNLKKRFVRIIKNAQKKYKFELNGFSILDNEFRFIIHTLPNGTTLDRIMQYIKSKFALLYNKINKRTGPFWNERYKDEIIENKYKSKYYFNLLICYLGLYPVKYGIANIPEDYIYSSFEDHFGKGNKLGIKITKNPLFDHLLLQKLYAIIQKLVL